MVRSCLGVLHGESSQGIITPFSLSALNIGRIPSMASFLGRYCLWYGRWDVRGVTRMGLTPLISPKSDGPVDHSSIGRGAISSSSWSVRIRTHCPPSSSNHPLPSVRWTPFIPLVVQFTVRVNIFVASPRNTCFPSSTASVLLPLLPPAPPSISISLLVSWRLTHVAGRDIP